LQETGEAYELPDFAGWGQGTRPRVSLARKFSRKPGKKRKKPSTLFRKEKKKKGLPRRKRAVREVCPDQRDTGANHQEGEELFPLGQGKPRRGAKELDGGFKVTVKGGSPVKKRNP